MQHSSFLVYDKFARPKSRRSSESLTEATDRPRTSRGRRSTSEDIERPMSRRGHRASASEPFERQASRRSGQVDDEMPPERPLTRHGRRPQQHATDSARAKYVRSPPCLFRGDTTESLADVLALDTELEPSPPPRSSARSRPKSAKGRTRPRLDMSNVDRGKNPG